MKSLFNLAQKLISIQDLSHAIDFNLVNQEFNKLHWKNNIENTVSVEMNFFDKDLFIDAKNYIETECETFINTTLAIKDFYERLKMTNSWGNVTDPGKGHHDHMHPFSIVSGVIFLDNHPDNVNLYIEGYTQEIPYFIPHNKSYVGLKHLLADLNIDPAQHNNLKNHMVLFLSNCHHFVEKTDGNGLPRKTIAFNTFWDGNVGIKQESLGSYKF